VILWCFFIQQTGLALVFESQVELEDVSILGIQTPQIKPLGGLCVRTFLRRCRQMRLVRTYEREPKQTAVPLLTIPDQKAYHEPGSTAAAPEKDNRLA